MKKEELREKIREERAKGWIRDSFMLMDKKPEDTLKIMFDLCEFSDRLNKNLKGALCDEKCNENFFRKKVL
jgi:hypothetical protein